MATYRALTVTAVVCAILFLSVALAMNILWRRSFFYDGIRGIKIFQEEAESPTLTYLHNVISKLYGSKTFMMVVFVVYFSMRNKIAVLTFLIYFYCKNYTVYTLKLAFMDPRPFWSTTTVKQLEWGCPDQFGNPSGHSSSMFLFYMLVYDVVLRRDAPVLLFLTSAIGLSVPVSRLYLGAHSTNQVLLGMLIELAFLVIYRYKMQEVLYNLLNKLIRRKHASQIVYILLVYLLVLIVPYVAYQIRARNPTGQPFIGNMLIGCPKSKTRTGLQMLTQTFSVAGFVGIVFGILVGIFLSERENYRYLYGQWRYFRMGLMSFVLRFLLQATPTLIVYWLLNTYVPQHYKNAYVKYFSVSLGMFLTGFLPVYFSRRILLGCQIIYETRVPHPPLQAPQPICC